MIYSYPFTLCRRAVVVTMDLAAKNLELFNTDHWLGNSKNCIVLKLSAAAWNDGSPPAPEPRPRDKMATWTCQNLHDDLEAHDMTGLAAQLHNQSVDGSDFLSLSEEALTHELRLTPFAAKKLLKAREVFLNSP